jgi:hypothetical protein
MVGMGISLHILPLCVAEAAPVVGGVCTKLVGCHVGPLVVFPGCQPIEEGEEYEFINSMIEELNAKYGLELSQEYSLYQPSLTNKPDRHDIFEDKLEKVVLMGGSHSSRMIDELNSTCLEVVEDGRSSEKTVEEKVKELTEIVSQCNEKRTTIIYQLYDNCSFFATAGGGHGAERGQGAARARGPYRGHGRP